jgi:hypothetical protein
MPESRRCVVKLRDLEGVEHVVQVTAGSLYEAACVALHQFRHREWSREALLQATTLHVEVWQAPMVYQVSVDRLEKWLARGGGSPREVALRHKIRNRMNE